MASRSRNAKSEGALDPALPQKKRARRRLVGAAAVCLAAAIILPIVLDSEPRQIRDDVQVQIPSRDTPLGERSTRNGLIVAPGEAERSAAGKADAKADAQPAQSESSPKAQADVDPKAKSEPQARPEAQARPEPQQKSEPQAKPEPQAKAAPQSKSGGYAVQIGAFSSAKGVADQTERARKAGFKTYTEKLNTPQGERTRVRVGPFSTRDAAEAARAKLRAAGIESTLIAPDR